MNYVRLMETLSREQIIQALERLNAELERLECRAEIFLVGGAVMCLALDARPATKDLDGWFTEPEAVRSAAHRVAEELSLPKDWLNDAAKAYIPEHAVFEGWASFSRLQISISDDRTMLAMKCAAARTTEDAGDIRFLAGRLGLRSSDEVSRLFCRSIPLIASRSGPISCWRRCSMTALECLYLAQAAGESYQRSINAFIDDFRRATPEERELMIADPIREQGQIEGLIAGVVSALCRETDTPTPEWVRTIGSPEPFFAFPARSFELRVRLMFESPAPFRIRNVFVPENYLLRA